MLSYLHFWKIYSAMWRPSNCAAITPFCDFLSFLKMIITFDFRSFLQVRTTVCCFRNELLILFNVLTQPNRCLGSKQFNSNCDHIEEWNVFRHRSLRRSLIDRITTVKKLITLQEVHGQWKDWTLTRARLFKVIHRIVIANKGCAI